MTSSLSPKVLTKNSMHRLCILGLVMTSLSIAHAANSSVLLIQDDTSATRNINAGITLATRPVNNNFPFQHQRGAGMLVGVWDGGRVRGDHVEFMKDGISRVDNKGTFTTSYDDHATHVAGTIAAAGVNSAAQGMAPVVVVWAFNMQSDEELMAQYAAKSNDSRTNLYVSNHSYGPDFGWAYNSSEGRVDWTGPDDTNQFTFAMYADDASNVDQIVASAPFYLPFFATGNSRTDSASSMGLTDGDTYYRTSDQETYTQTIYNEATAPLGNDWWFEGMGTVNGGAVAKNCMSVGAVDAAVVDEMRVISQSGMSTFSDWGPTDDGRIKPDLVADGVDMLSVGIASTNAYETMSGTSMATPAACGAAALLQQMHYDLYGMYMLSDKLKTLILHTCDDVDAPGPDYRTGWGLMNAAAAAHMLQIQYDHPSTLILTNDTIESDSTASNTYSFTYSGFGPIKATMAWVDPAGIAHDNFERNTNSVLVNDLDIRLYSPNETLYKPYVLDPSNPTNYAGTADNFRDNVEQINVSSPSEAGTWKLVVTHKGSFSSTQNYALALTGARVQSATPVFNLLGPGNEHINAMDTKLPFLTAGSATTITFSVYNEGSTDLVVQMPKLYGSSAFTFPSSWASTATLTAGESQSFDVTYTPLTSSDVSESHLYIYHNASNNSPFVCRLMGERLNVNTSETVLTNGYNTLQQTITQTTGMIQNIRVGLSMSADDMAGCEAILRSPDESVEKQLFDVNIVQGEELDNTTFDPQAFLSITNGKISAPYRGSYLPADSLDAFRGLPATGTWSLVVYKNEQISNATVDNWWIQFDTVKPMLSISGNAFYESPLCNGTFTNTLVMTLTNGTIPEFGIIDWSVTNLPSGLTGVVSVGSTTLSLDLTGAMTSRTEKTHPYVSVEFTTTNGQQVAEHFDFSLITYSDYAFAGFSASPTNVTIPSAGGSTNISVIAPPAQFWTAYSTFAPLSWDGTPSGLGNSALQFSIPQNYTTNSRPGTIIVGNKVIEFTQEAAAPTPGPTATPTPGPTATPSPTSEAKPVTSWFLLLLE